MNRADVGLATRALVGFLGISVLLGARATLHQRAVVEYVGFGPNDEPPMAMTVRRPSHGMYSESQLCRLAGRVSCPERERRLTLLVDRAFTLSVAESRIVGAMLFYKDTVKNPEVLRDSIGVRLVGAEGAVAVQPSETRYARVSPTMGPWRWTVAPARAGNYTLLLQIVRLPRYLEPLLDQATGMEPQKEGDKVLFRAGPDVRRDNELHVEVRTAAGLTAKWEAVINSVTVLFGLLVAGFTLRGFVMPNRVSKS